jgi:MYXO-CTERM domain-containing protein
VGDIDGDDLLEVVTPTRAGWLYAWNTVGPADGAISWESYHHDNRNTGNYETPLERGRHTVAAAPLDCSAETPPNFPRPLPDECYPEEDAGDGGETVDDGGDVPGPESGGGGCACRALPGPGGSGALLAAALALAAVRRRRRR